MTPLESPPRVFVQLHPEDTARGFEGLHAADGARLIKNRSLRVAARPLEPLSPHAAGPLLQQTRADRLNRGTHGLVLREVIFGMKKRAMLNATEALAQCAREAGA